MSTLKKNFGESGNAEVRPGKTAVRIAFEERSYEVPVSGWDKNRPAGTYRVTMSKDGTKILSVRPPAGTYIMKFKNMGNKVADVPEPKIQRGGPRQSRDGSKHWIAPDSLIFVTIQEVLSDGKYQGLEVYNNVPYIFSQVPGSNMTKLEASGKNELERVETYLRVAGFDLAKNDIPYSDNILPWLERYLQKNGRAFLGTLGENGFISTFADLPPELAPKAKKAKK